MEEHISTGISPKYDSGNTWNTSLKQGNIPENNLESVGKAKLDSLKETVLEIEKLIEERSGLSGSFIQEGEKMKRDIKNFLLENVPKGEDDSEFARERADLRKKQIEISELQLNEKVGCWRDIALLKKELRDRTKELNEKISRAEIFEGILDE
ncbi:MAG: hypothetical protein U9Q73_02265 [Nanoarchaeota archaeon]|nr:hypothetical protein [Nanoarchaeota archaeon]